MELSIKETIKKTFDNGHPFEQELNAGRCTKEQIQKWLVNRYYFEETMVKKDFIVLSKCPDRAFRNVWINRILDADQPGGGLDRWVKMGESCSVDVTDNLLLTPATKFACDAFLAWCKDTDWVEVVSSSLSQLQAVLYHKSKAMEWPEMYPWIDINYFKLRREQAGEDARRCLDFIIKSGISMETIDKTAQLKRNMMKVLLDSI